MRNKTKKLSLPNSNTQKKRLPKNSCFSPFSRSYLNNIDRNRQHQLAAITDIFGVVYFIKGSLFFSSQNLRENHVKVESMIYFFSVYCLFPCFLSG